MYISSFNPIKLYEVDTILRFPHFKDGNTEA